MTLLLRADGCRERWFSMWSDLRFAFRTQLRAGAPGGQGGSDGGAAVWM